MEDVAIKRNPGRSREYDLDRPKSRQRRKLRACENCGDYDTRPGTYWHKGEKDERHLCCTCDKTHRFTLSGDVRPTANFGADLKYMSFPR